MPEVDALFWALKTAYGRQCLEDGHELTFAGEGFIARLGRGGQVTLRVADGPSSPVQGWLMAALAEFLAPAGATRHAGGGVSVRLGGHMVHFRSDGTVRWTPAGRVEAEPPAATLTTGAHVPTTVPATGRHLGSLGQTLDAASEPHPPAGPPPHQDGPAARPAQPAPGDPTAPVGEALPSPPPAEKESLSDGIASLAARWLQSPTNGVQDVHTVRAQINGLLQRVRDGELPDPVERRAALRNLAGMDASLRTREQAGRGASPPRPG